MVSDLLLIKEVWNGSITARFMLAPHEVSGAGKPPPCYLVLQRNSYFPLFIDKIKKHFSTFGNEFNSEDVWFDYDGTPLKWHYPIGVLCDLLCFNSHNFTMDITVHFQDFPNEGLIRLHQTDAIESNFMAMLKEADYLKHRGQVINNMNKSQHKQLWNSLRNRNFDQFWAINGKLMEGHEERKRFKYVPIRIYYKEKLLQELFHPENIEDDQYKEVTLHDCIKGVITNHLPLLLQNFSNTKVIIHGINVPFNSPIQWLSENLSSADNFLHVVLIG